MRVRRKGRKIGGVKQAVRPRKHDHRHGRAQADAHPETPHAENPSGGEGFHDILVQAADLPLHIIQER